MFDTRNIPSFTSLKFATAVGSHLSMCCHCTSIRSFREVPAETQLDNCTSPRADSMFRPYEWGPTVLTISLTDVQNNQKFWLPRFLGLVWKAIFPFNYNHKMHLIAHFFSIGLSYSIEKTMIRFFYFSKGGIHSPAEKINEDYYHGIFKLKDQKSWYLREQL